MTKAQLTQIAGLLLLAGTLSLKAGNDTWVGNTSANWNDANWTGANNPPITGDALFFGLAGSAGTSLNNNSAATSFAGLTFNYGASAYTFTGNSFTPGGNIIDNAVNTETLNFPIALSASRTVNVTSGGNLTIGGVISGTGFGITNVGPGTLDFNGSSPNAYTGSTVLNNGTLYEDFSNLGATANLISGSSALILGGGTLEINGNAANASSQTVNGTTSNPGYNQISAWPNGGNMSDPLPTLNLGGLTQNLGSTLVIVGPSYDTNYSGAATVTNVPATATVTTTSLGFNTDLLWPGARSSIATVGLYEWASVVTSGSGAQTIYAGSQQTATTFYTQIAAGGSFAAGDVNVDLLGNATETTTGTMYVDTVRFNVPGASSLSPSGSRSYIGGILVTPNVGANNTTIAATGHWVSCNVNGANADLDVYQNNTLGNLLFNDPIQNAKTYNTAYAQAGAGTVDLTGAGANSSYTLSAYLNGGCTIINNNAQLGVTTTAAPLYLNGGTVVASGLTTSLDNGGGSNKRPVTLLGNGGGLAAEAGDSLTVDGQITSAANTGPLVIGIPASAANGNVAGLLPGTGSNTANTTPVYATGTVILNYANLTAGNSQFGGTIILGGATLNINSEYDLGGIDQGPTTFNGGTLQYAATLATGAAGAALDISAQPVTLTGNGTIDVNGHVVTYANSIGNGGSGQLIVTNSTAGGGLFLNGGSTHTGGTVVNGLLGGNGTIVGNVMVNSGGQTLPSTGAGATTTITGSLTYNTGSSNSFNLGTTYNSAANDKIVLNGNGQTLTCGGVKVGINCGANLDLTHDYVLFNLTGTSPTLAGSFNPMPVWLGTTPTGAANYQVVTNATQVLLHYSGSTPPTISASSATPSTVVRNQNNVLVSVTVAGAGVSTITGVSVNNGVSPVSLTLTSGTSVSGTWTGNLTIPASTAPGTLNLVATATDKNANTATVNIPVTVNAETETWVGGGGGNWSANADWVNPVGNFAPGLTGDTLVFAGSTGPTSTMDNSYTITGLTFTNGAGSFNIGTSGSTLTITASGVVNNSSSPETLNVPVLLTNAAQTLSASAGSLTLGQGVDNGGNLLTVSDAGFSTTISGPVTDTGGLTKLGSGTLTLAGANTYAGNTLVSGGTVVVNGIISNGLASASTVTDNSSLTVNTGGAIITGNSTTSTGLIIGNVAGNSTMTIAGGAVNVNEMGVTALAIGSVTGANGFLFMSSGSLDCSGGEFHIGQAAGAYGAFDLTGGTVTEGDLNAGDAYFVVGGAYGNSASEGVMNMSGGTINDNAQQMSLGNIAGSIGVLNASGGTINDNKGIGIGSRGSGILNVSGSAALNFTGAELEYGLSGNTTVGTVNLLGGTVTANNVGIAGTSTSRLNLNGGTLQAGALSATFLQGLTAATVYSGGANINDGGFAITIAQPLLAPVGNGVSSIPVATGGAGYLDTPIVSITGGGGAGATAVATVAGGSVTGIVVTSPGTGYTSPPTVTLFGGGYSTAATLGTPAIAPGVSGGLTKQGAGTLTLTGASTYTNLTIVNNGTLALGAGYSGATAGYVVTNGATLDVSAISPFTLLANESLSGTGTINGSIATSSGVSIIPATIGTPGTLTFNNDLDLSGGGTGYFDISTSGLSGNDQISVGGTLTLNGGALHLRALSGSANLDTNNAYVLFNNANRPNVVGLTALIWDGTTPANYNHFLPAQSANNIVLQYSSAAVPVISSLTFKPPTVVRGQNVTITATIVPGAGMINPSSGVMVNLTQLGGSATYSLIQSNSSNLYTNTFSPVPAAASPGSLVFTATVADSTPLFSSGNGTLVVSTASDIWTGLASGNWSDNGDWVNFAGDYAPGLVGDTLIFAGTSGLSPNMDQAYSITSLTFSNNAGSFNIGTSGNPLTITAGGVTNLSANAETLNLPVNLTSMPQTLNAANGNLTLSQNIDNGGNELTVTDGGHTTEVDGVITDSGGLTKSGPGTLILTAGNSYTGNTVINGGTLLVTNSGAINYGGGGPTANVGEIIVGNAPGNSVLNMSGGDVYATDTTAPSLAIGNVAGASGFLQLSSGTLYVSSELHIGQATNAYGAFDLTGGNVTALSWFVVGGAFGNSASEGVFNMSGGNLTDNADQLSIGNIAGAVGVANISGGTISSTAGSHVGERGTGTLNVSGSADVNFTGGTLGFGLNSTATGAGTINLLGGTVTANNVANFGTGTAQLNFNGGELQAAEANAGFIAGLNGATIYSGGAIIDDGGNAITSTQALLAPTGNGVSSIPVNAGGASYLDTPVVNVSGGGGSGASAVANVSGGAVTSITVVCPGTGYTSAPTVTLYGGGYSTAATLGTATLAPNVGGGLTKQNSGTLTLAGANTYTGNTTVNGGTLELVQATLPRNATVNIAGGAVLQLDFSVTNAVTNLVLNGTTEPLGVYNSTTGSPYITGAGSLQVVAPVVIASNPTNITFTVVSLASFKLSWPADHLGWIVQSNSVSLAVAADWQDILSTASGTNYLVNVNPAQPNVFYRLRHP